MNNPIKTGLLGLLTLYQWTMRPILGPRCRFYPSCSDYAREAIVSHGVAAGGLLTVKRLCKCHPFNDGGVDPVPEHTAPSPMMKLWIRND